MTTFVTWLFRTFVDCASGTIIREDIYSVSGNFSDRANDRT